MRPRITTCRSCSLLTATALIAVASAARAFDPFEIQVYDGTADAPGEKGLELHLNRAPGEWHATLEPSYGVLPFWEVGGYLETANGEYAGAKLRSKLVHALGDFRFGVNLELSNEKVAGWGGEIRPILAFENDRFILVMNPNIEFPIAFAPCAMAKIKLGPIAVGPEWYGTFPDDEQYLFGAVDLIAVKNFELNVAVGAGHATIGKMILGYVF